MKPSTILSALLLILVVFCLFGRGDGAGLFAAEEPSHANPSCPEEQQVRSWGDLRSPGPSELEQPLARYGLALASALGSQDPRGTSGASWQRWSTLLHALVGLALFWCFQRSCGSRSLAGLGALLFVLHPLAVESVTWITMSPRLLSSVLVCLAVAAWSGSKGKLRWLALPLGLLALAAHPMAAPGGLLLLWISLARRPDSPREYGLPLVLLVAGGAWLLHAGTQSWSPLSLGERLLSAGAAPWLHLKHSLLPITPGDLVVHPQLLPGQGVLVIAGWSLTLLLLSAGAWLLRRATEGLSQIGLGLLWFLSFSLGSALLPYQESIGSDSDGYLALAGLVLSLIGLFVYALRRTPKMPLGLSAMCVLLLGLLGFFSLQEVEFRRNELKVLKRCLDAERSRQAPATNFVAHRRLGLELLWHGDLTSADAHLEHALSQSPEDALALAGRARIALQRDEKQQARAFLMRASQLEPRDARTWERLGELGLREGTQDGQRLAIESLRRAVECDPYFAHAHSRLASMLSFQYGANDRANLQEAERLAQRAIELDPSSKEAWKALGTIRERLEDPAGARQAYERSLELEPDYSEALAGLGKLLQREGEAERALEVLERSYELHPLDPNNAFELASAYRAAGRLPESKQLFRVTIGLNRRHMRAHEGLGWILLGEGDTLAAIAEGELMTSFRTSHPGARLLLAEANERERDYTRAILCLKIAIEGQPGLLDAQARLALLLAAAPDAADRVGQRALELAQELVSSTQASHAPSLRALAAAKAELGDFAGAKRELQRAQRLGAAELSEVLDEEARLYGAERPLRLPAKVQSEPAAGNAGNQ